MDTVRGYEVRGDEYPGEYPGYEVISNRGRNIGNWVREHYF